jgi:CRP-like cAMP-binding protein
LRAVWRARTSTFVPKAPRTFEVTRTLNSSSPPEVLMTNDSVEGKLPEFWFVRETAFDKRMGEQEMAQFVEHCSIRRYRRGDMLFRMLDPALELFIITEGQIKLVRATARGTERILAIGGPNDIVGEAFLSGKDCHRADAVALTDAAACVVTPEKYRLLVQQMPRFGQIFTEILSTRLFHCREYLVSSCDPVKIRVMKVLTELTYRFGKPLQVGWYELDTELGHDDIAAMVNATRVSVTTAFTELRDRGLLEGTRGQYRLNVPALESLANE